MKISLHTYIFIAILHDAAATSKLNEVASYDFFVDNNGRPDYIFIGGEMKMLSIAKELQPDIVKFRRDFHKYPELGWTEFRTASIVAKTLEENGFGIIIGEDAMDGSMMKNLLPADELESQMKRALAQGAHAQYLEKMRGGKTAVVGVLDTGRPGAVIAMRFDMDALPIQELQTDSHFPAREGFASVNDGVMHSCAHDGHTAVGLGMAMALAKVRDKLTGVIKLIFQPAEEGVQGGATSIIKKGLIDDVSHMLSFHIGLAARTGEIYCQTTDFFAITEYHVDFTGKEAHAAANPELGKSALLAAAAATMGLQGIYRHSAGASRINVGMLASGQKSNIVPNKAVMKLETRGATTEINNFMKREAERVINAAAQMYDVRPSIRYGGESITAVCDPSVTQATKQIAQELGIFEHVKDILSLNASEDYTYFMEYVQNRGGVAGHFIAGANLDSKHHTIGFNFDEDVLWRVVALLGALVFKFA